MEFGMNHYLQLMTSLPPLVAAVVWDVVNDRITESTVELAQATTKEEFKQYDIIRCVVAAHPDYPPLELAKGLVDEMLETAALIK
jgi:hypothetical protein